MTRPRCSNEARLLDAVRRNRSVLMASTALQAAVMLVLSLPADAQPAPNARPSGGTVVAGAAAISQAGSNTAIHQSTQRAAVNWKSFDVGSQQSVTFRQPSANSVTLNRVVGPDPSQIAGRIDANGQVVLVNQSGVTFYKGALVNTNGLLVTAAGISNQNFMAGAMKFDQPAKPNARVENQGSITIKEAGLAALVAPQVANSGVINARLGHVVLAGAKTATLDLYGDGLLSLDVGNQVTQTPVDRNGNAATALVTNTGVIIADGGTVQLTARAADGIVQNLVHAGGKIRAASVGDRAGTVALNGVGGAIVVEGQLSAAGRAPGSTGGNIEVVSDGNVVVASTARINASGRVGGGVVAVGTTLYRAKGGPGVTPTLVAASTVIQKGANVSADATTKGNGGRVVVLSSQSTNMAGTITARGGSSGGHGGFVEVSGNAGYSVTGLVDVAAPAGALGTILLDPLDLTIGTATTDDDLLGAAAPQMTFNTVPTDASGNAFISAATVSQLRGNIDLQASHDLTVTAPITLTTAGQSLTLEAGRNLTVALGGAITTTGDVTLTAAAGAPATPPPLNFPGGFSSTGALTLNDNVTTTGANLGDAGFVAGNITLNAGTGGAAITGNVNVTSGSLKLTSLGGITQSGNSTMSSGPGGTVTITAAGDLIQSANTRIFGDTVTVSIGRNLQQSDNAFITTVLGGAVNAVSVTAGGNIAQTGNAAILATNALTLTAGGSLGQSGSANILSANNGATVTAQRGDVTLSDASSIKGGAFVAVSAPAGKISLASSSSVTGPRVTLNAGNGGVRLTGSAALGQINGLVDITSGGPVTEDATSTIQAGELTSTGGVAGNMSLLGTNNAIATLADITATKGDLTVVDGADLTLFGTLKADNLFFEVARTGGVLTIGFTDDAPAPIPAALDAVGTTGRISLVADNFNVLVDTAPTPNSVTTAAGTVELAPFSAIGTSLLGSGGLVLAPTLLNIIRTGGGTLEVGGFTDAPGEATLPTARASTVDIANALDLSAIASTLRLDSTGSITQTGGPLIAATLTGSAGTFANLSRADNLIGTLGAFSTTAGFALVDNRSLLVTGPVNDAGAASTLALTTKAGDITLTGPISATHIVDLISAGSINQSGGKLIAGTLTGTAAGEASLAGNNQIAVLGDFSAANFALNDGTDLLISGTLNAADIAVRAPVNQISLGDRATIVTGGSVRPPGMIQSALEPVTGTTPGAYFKAAGFTPVGSSRVVGMGGGPATLQIAVTGNMQFDPPLGLQATGTWLILNLTNGTASGNVFANALDVSYTTPGGTNLHGSIQGKTGGDAAAAGFIQPAVNANYLFNGCVIGATVCQPFGLPDSSLTSALGGLYHPFLPGAPPTVIGLQGLVLVALPMLPASPRQLTDPDVVPPNISYLDY